MLKGKHRSHEKVIIREWGAQQPEHLHEKQILLISTYRFADVVTEKELGEDYGDEEAVAIVSQYALTHVNNFTTLTTEPFTSSKVDDVSFSRVLLTKEDKLPNEETLGQIKKLVK